MQTGEQGGGPCFLGAGPEQGTEKKRPQREIGTSDQKVALGPDRLSSLKSVPLTDVGAMRLSLFCLLSFFGESSVHTY